MLGYIILILLSLIVFFIWQLTKEERSVYQQNVDKYGKEKVDKGLDRLLDDIFDQKNDKDDLE